VNPTRPPARCRMPASSALVMPADARSRRAAAATTRSSVGRAAAATARSPSAARGGSAASRAPSSSWRSSGTGSGSPGAGRTPCPMRARAISRANNGFPSEIRWSRSRMGWVRSPPVRARRRRVIASSANGPREIRAGADAQRHQDPDRRILKAADHERQHSGRGRVQPLDIVDRDDHRSGSPLTLGPRPPRRGPWPGRRGSGRGRRGTRRRSRSRAGGRARWRSRPGGGTRRRGTPT
jgi:hypothetical protein